MAFLAGVEGRRVASVDGREFGVSGWSLGWPLAMSDDGQVIACRLQRPGRECVWINGAHGPEYDAVGTPALSADGRVVAYRARQGERHFVVVGDGRGPEFELVTDPALTPDGGIAAYAGSRDGRWVLVHGDRLLDIPRQPFGVFVSPDGRRVGWWYFDGPAARVVVGGVEGEAFDLVGRPVFSPDGTRVAYAANRATRQYVVVDGKCYEAPGRVSDPEFGPDGTSVGYGAVLDGRIRWRVLKP